MVLPAQQKLILNVVGGVALAAFVTGLFFIPRYRPPPTQPNPAAAASAPAVAPIAAQDPPEDHLAGVASALELARTDLNKASVGNKGGFVEKARTDADRALKDAAEALAFVRAHPELRNQPAPPLTAELAAQFAADHSGRPIPTSGIPNLRKALAALRTASDELQLTPGGALGGFRDSLNKDIQQTASDTISGIEVATYGAADGG